MSSNSTGSRAVPRSWDNKGPYEMPKWQLDDDVVISGFSGRYPESNSVEELKHNLFEGVDMITENDRRWKPGLFGTPKRMGKLKEIDRFDRLFFGVHGKQADMMDPMHRLLLEATYEAIFDSGFDPSTFRGKNVGVFVGCSDRSYSGEYGDEDMLTGYELLGMSVGMLANRVSFSFGFTGPSMAVDTACSSTMHAFNEAVLALRNNRCDAAIVGGGTISLSVNMCVSFARLGLLSKEGTCKVFDNTANGYVRSEAVGAIFLQKSSDAKRCYATVLHCKLNNDGFKPEGISFPSSALQKQLFKEVFSELDMNPADIDYVEAHGTGTVAGDREESNAIADFFCPGRDKPLPVGSVKSNLGHAEAASGTCTIAKVVLSMEEGFIAPNLHYKEANSHVPALLDGKMKVVAEKTPWKPGIVAANNFGFGGSNATVVLKANMKEKSERKERIIPRLTLVCGRSEAGVQHIFKKIADEQFTDEALVLLEDGCMAPTLGMRYRGYAMVQKPGEELTPVIETAPTFKRPVWFLFSGMGSQWSGMAKSMMKLDIFAKSIKASAQVLKPYGVDLIHLLNTASEKDLNHIVAPFVTIAAVQIALVDVVRALGISPDGIVGHSVGELGCAYADGCLTAEQMLMAAYWRGTSCTKTKLIYGAMAAVGMTWEETKKRCPKGVFPVCHNAEDSVTISGPAEAVKKFVEELTAQNTFARIVKTCDIAFHSQYVEPASHIMRKELAKIITKPLPRSARWVSSSVPENQWDKPEAQLSSVDYHVNNLLSPVLFKEAMDKVPKNAIVIEFAPHSLLQAIVKRILGPESKYIGLMKKGEDNNLIHCLNAIGQMYTAGLNPSAKNLYPPISFPVPRGTPMLNSLIQWNHSEPVFTLSYDHVTESRDLIVIDTFKGSSYNYLLGHKIDGRVLFPFMGYVFLAWKVLAKHLKVSHEELRVVVEDFSVYRATILPKTGEYNLHVKFLNCDGNFRIVDQSKTIVASGRICEGDENVLKFAKKKPMFEPERKQVTADETEKEQDKADDTNKVEINVVDDEQENEDDVEDETTFTLDAQDFYKELRLRGYEYGPTFQGVVSADAHGRSGKIKWDDQWVSFMDAMLQIPILCVPLRALLLPTRVKSIRIDPTKKPAKTGEEVKLEFNRNTNICRAGPVEIQGMHCGIAPKKKDYKSSPVLEKSVFVPLYDYNVLTKKEMNKVEEYSHACSTLAHRILVGARKSEKEITSILNSYKEVPNELTEELLKMKDKKHVLLKVLNGVLDNSTGTDLKKSVKEVLTKHSTDIGQDLLSTQILNESALRASLDVVQDNTFSSKMKILEISVNPIIKKDVLKMLNMTTLGLMNFDYSIARVTEDAIPEGVVESSTKITNVKLTHDTLPAENDLVVAKDLFTDGDYDVPVILKSISDSLKAKGFILFVERTRLSPAEKFIATVTDYQKREQNETQLEKAFQTAGLAIICKKKDQMTSVMYLLRKKDAIATNGSHPVVVKVGEENNFSWVAPLQAVIKENEDSKLDRKIWLVADNPNSGIIGFVNCVKQEPGGKHVRCLFDSNVSSLDKIPSFQINNPFYKEVIQNDLLFNVIKDGRWGMFRHQLLDADPDLQSRKCSFLQVTKRGDLSSIKWIENVPSTTKCSDPNMVPVDIYYSALNFRDIMLASGKLPTDALPERVALQESVLGLECVGRDPKGRRVMGISLSKAMANYIELPKEMLIEVPDFWTMEQASTVPVVYLTSYYALLVRGQMRPKESVLIHSGTGGVGQAAISIALSMGCQIFTTVGSEEKKQYLKSLFPEIKDENILNSRDTMFEIQVLNATDGRGVDLVLNSLAEDKLQASVRCLRKHGRFLEIGKYDIAMNKNLGMAVFNKNISFHGIFLDTVFDDKNREVLEVLKDLVRDGIKKGVVRPIKANVFPWDKAEEAFRFMASGKHIGKVVLKIRDEEKNTTSLKKPLLIPSDPRSYFSSEKSYIVTGGLGGVGFELASWLVERGARKLVLSSRSPVKNEYQRLWMERWKNEGTQIVISNDDIATADGVKTLLNSAKALGPVGGIFHLAMVLSDGLFENLKVEDFEKVAASKVLGVKYLDSSSRQVCPQLDHFVVFSSISCGRGNPGQSNYGYTNSVMERVVELRREAGLPGLAIQWGGIGDVGVVYDKMGGNEVILKGTIPQRLTSCLEVMDRFLQEDNTVVSSFVPLEKAAFGSDSGDDVVAMLCKVLGVKDPSTVKPEMTLGELGMDSLMGVEIKQVLETDYDTVLTVPEVRQLSIKDLEEIGKKRKESGINSNSSIEILANGVSGLTVSDMYVPTQNLIKMADSKDSRCIFMVHPIEGHVRMLKPLAKNIKCKVYGLEFTDDLLGKTIKEVATRYMKKIKEVQPRGPYRLLGYSYGTLLVSEIANQLQETDQVKTLIFLDSSPKTIKEIEEKYTQRKSGEKTQYTKELIQIFLQNYVKDIPVDIETTLLNLPEDDTATHLRNLLQPVLGPNFDIGLGMHIGERIKFLGQLATQYKCSRKFKGRATLIKASKGRRPEVLKSLAEEDFGLNECVDGNIEILTLKCDHDALAEDHSSEVSKIINDRI